MRESMALLTPRFSANRAVREYAEKYYLPAAASYLSRSAGKGVLGRKIADWRSGLGRKWAGLRFGGMRRETREGQHHFQVEVFLNGLEPQAVRVEMYADAAPGGAPFRQEMKPAAPPAGGPGGNLYGLEVPSDRPILDFTARVIPSYQGVAVPLEEGRILWQG
jgi:starch phosphorylase